MIKLTRIEEEFGTGAGGGFYFFDVVRAVKGQPLSPVFAGGHAIHLNLVVGALYAAGIEPELVPADSISGPSQAASGYVTGLLPTANVENGVTTLEFILSADGGVTATRPRGDVPSTAVSADGGAGPQPP